MGMPPPKPPFPQIQTFVTHLVEIEEGHKGDLLVSAVYKGRDDSAVHVHPQINPMGLTSIYAHQYIPKSSNYREGGVYD